MRVHPIITKGGDFVNSVPDDVRLELYVRAKTMELLIPHIRALTQHLSWRRCCRRTDRYRNTAGHVPAELQQAHE